MASAELRADIIAAMRNDGKVDLEEFTDIVKENSGDDISDEAIERAFNEMSSSDTSTPLAIRDAVGAAEEYDAEMEDEASGSDVDRAEVQDDVLDALSDDDQVSFAEFEAIYNKYGDGSMSSDELRDLYENADSFDAESMTDALMEAFGSGMNEELMDDVVDALADDDQVTFAEFQALVDKHGGTDMSDAELRDAYSDIDTFDAQSVYDGVMDATGGGSSSGSSGGSSSVSDAIDDAMADGRVDEPEFRSIALDAIEAAGLPRTVLSDSGINSIFAEIQREGNDTDPAEIQKGIDLAVSIARDIEAL
ncbi:hypothetical protein [Futiania mangrovi]|uniref:Uncharacterized protein n=1 Tax=Futiania mangrovi TaxID=2959716 RepID=A0A9J6PDU1_9PROT|nr:hypothetical protein [Futiania mangrovii]MCP1337573.1 hypothetical protein [Futiania mangrovii]